MEEDTDFKKSDLKNMNLKMDRSDILLGCLFGGAVGDSLGAPVEFLSLSEIRNKFGNDGIQSYAPSYGRLGAATDDTQMTLFTLEGLIRARNRATDRGIVSVVDCVRFAYIRWLGTQGIIFPDSDHEWIYSGWLWKQKQMHSPRAPGNTCLSALQYHLSLMQRKEEFILEEPINDSKGCGGVMRMAPVGFFPIERFDFGCDFARLTHSHPSGYLAAGFFAHLIGEIIEGSELPAAIESVRKILLSHEKHQEVLAAVDKAVDLAAVGDANPETVEKLGGGWVAEEALAISLFCALKAEDFVHGVRLAVNHSGDSDSTGSITGNILGTMWGRQAIPDEFLQELELRDIIEEIVKDLIVDDFSDAAMDKYPPN